MHSHTNHCVVVVRAFVVLLTAAVSPGCKDSVGVNRPAVARAIAVGWFHACALTSAARAYCWGANSGGQLGNGDLLPHEGGFTEIALLPSP